MTISLAETDDRVEELRALVSSMLSSPVEALELVGGGRNSRVYRLCAAPNQSYALKVYFRHASDSRTRMETEFSALTFLWRNGVRNIPEPLVENQHDNCAIYSWINGRRFAAGDATAGAIQAATAFLTRLAALRTAPGSNGVGLASEAHFSGDALLDHLRRRLEPLLTRTDDGELTAFLTDSFTPALTRICEWSCGRLADGFGQELPQPLRTLSPSDFGFHNGLETPAGEIFFLDLEYFGWDDPAKMICDFLLHPAMDLSDAHKRQFVRSLMEDLPFLQELGPRVEAFYPLFGLKWCMILLNEFLPEHLLRRRFAGLSEADRRQRQMEQLEKAKRKLRQITEEYEHFPYFT